MTRRSNKAKADLDHLQRSFRHLEATRKSQKDGTLSNRQQNQKLGKLKHDTQRVADALQLETRQAKRTVSTTFADRLARWQGQGDLYSRKIHLEKQRIEELEDAIREAEASLTHSRETMGGVSRAQDNIRQAHKNIRMLENRLHTALQKYNDALGNNKKLRATIEHLRREREAFNSIHKKLERDLAGKKSEMASIIQVVNEAYGRRDQFHADIVRLRSQAEEDQQAFEDEWQLLGEQMARQIQLANIVPETTMQTQIAALGGADILEDEELAQGELTEIEQTIQHNKEQYIVVKENVAKYQDAFDKIKEATGKDDIDELVETFLNAEEANFELFNEVNDLSNELERVKDHISKLNEEADRYRTAAQSAEKRHSKSQKHAPQSGPGNKQDAKRKAMLKLIQDEIAFTRTKAENCEHKHAEAIDTVKSLQSGIGSILTTLAPDDGLLQAQLDTEGVSETNLMDYLGAIEARTNQLMQDLSIATGQSSKSTTVLPVSSAIDLSGDALPSIVPPSALYSDDDDDDDEDDDESLLPIDFANIQGERNEARAELTDDEQNEPDVEVAVDDEDEVEAEAENNDSEPEQPGSPHPDQQSQDQDE